MLYTFITRKDVFGEALNEKDKAAVIYHDIFDFPLSFAELIKWSAGEDFARSGVKHAVSQKGGYFFVEGREGIIYKRLLRKRISAKKFEIAKRASKILSSTPTVKMVAVTGSLAMENSAEDGDIDLMIVTKRGTLWTTRLVSYLVTSLLHIKIRRPGDKNQKDKLCLNMWLDEGDLVFRNRNVYTAHEIAQITPLVNKDNTYERLIYKNKWILKFWPNSVQIQPVRKQIVSRFSPIARLVEKLAFWLQYQYMKSKITREVISPTRALFHPQDWGQVVLDRLKTLLVE